MEHFAGRDHTVHLSAGGTYELFRGLITLAGRHPEASFRDVAAFLRTRMLHDTKSGWGFSCDPVPVEIREPARRLALATLLDEFMVEISKEAPDPGLASVVWGRELRLSWLARLLDLRQFVVADLESVASPVLALSAEDELECRVQRVRARKGELFRRMRDGREFRKGLPDETLQAAFALVERLIALVVQMTPSPGKREYLRRELDDQADLFLAKGDRIAAARALRRSAELTDDEELRSATLEYAEALEEEPG